MLPLFLFLFSSSVLADTAPLSSKVAPPCVETGIKGEEKCTLQTAPTPLTHPQIILPEKKPVKRVLETPRKK